eukprot:CFRG6662T1
MPLEDKSSENEALLPRNRSDSGRDHSLHVVCGSGKVPLIASSATLLLGVLGAGQLTLPFAVSQSGFLLSATYLSILGLLAVLVLKMLMVSSTFTSQNTYAALLDDTLGYKASSIANTFLGIYAWGGAVSFLILVADELDSLSTAFMWNQPRWILISTLALLVVYPLSMCQNLERLKFTSYLGATAAIYITIVVCINAPWGQNGYWFETCGGAEVPVGDPLPYWEYFPTSAIGAFNALPLIAFALNSAWCFVPILNSLYDPTPTRVNNMIVSANAIILTNYGILAFVGYFSYCNHTKDNILSNLPSTPAVIIARIMLIMQLCFALPLRFHVTRGVMYEQIPNMPETQLSMPSSTTREKIIYTLVTTSSVLLAVLIAALTTNLHVVIGLTSAICASFTIYIFPALSFRVAVAAKEPHGIQDRLFMNIAPWLCVAAGVCVLVLGTGAILIEVAMGMKVVGG